MPKNIVICCDGTGNKFDNETTNVIKLYSALDLDDSHLQIGYYHPGLGTMGAPGAVTRLARWWTRMLGLAFGYGIAANIGDAYSYLIANFQPGDRVYLFGFSRGAYTVRALASVLHLFGLVRKGSDSLVPYVTCMLKGPREELFKLAPEFKATFAVECKPHFIGVWDSVSSVGWAYDPISIPYTARNPDIKIGRHAVAIDERRCFFRQNLWTAPGPGQDLKQLWFAGVHCDVGGGYKEEESGLSKIALEWMADEAIEAGLQVKPERLSAVLAKGEGPNPAGPIHRSLSGAWLALEVLPRKAWDTTCDPARYKWKLPFGARRRIPANAELHPSVLDRMRLVPGYRPAGLPEQANGRGA